MVKIFRNKDDLKKEVQIFRKDAENLFIQQKEIKQLFVGCLWAEGPVYLKSKEILVWSDIPFNRMLYYDTINDSTGVFRYPSNFSNGNSTDLEGNLITAEHGRRAISKTNEYGEVSIISNEYDGKKLNSPNDLITKSDGTIWFTDPQYGIKTNFEGYQSPSELGFNGVYMIDNNNKTHLMTSEIEGPNGIAFSPDEKILYVTDTGETGLIYSFKVTNNKISNKKKFAKPRPGSPDGIKVDMNGNVFSSAWDGVHIFSPKGDLLAKIQVPEQRTANLCFGGKNYDHLYITSDKSLYSIKMKTYSKD